jgi:hypothetical protein
LSKAAAPCSSRRPIVLVGRGDALDDAGAASGVDARDFASLRSLSWTISSIAESAGSLSPARAVSTSKVQWSPSGIGERGCLDDLLRAMMASFDEARKSAPSTQLIDELDSFYSRQGDT